MRRMKNIGKDLKYLGSTLIEDELQEEKVETMRILRRGGIKIWMITGDKKERAISCAKNSGIINENNRFMALEVKELVRIMEGLNNEDLREEIENIYNQDILIIYRKRKNSNADGKIITKYTFHRGWKQRCANFKRFKRWNRNNWKRQELKLHFQQIL